MGLKFFKYQGTGNDFIMVDGRQGWAAFDREKIEWLCHRRFGIGADGFIVLEEAEGFDFRMVYYNADGREGSMCGNGGRCTVKFAHDLGIFTEKAKFIAVDGEHEANLKGGVVSLKMTDTGKRELRDGQAFYDTGSPHVVIPVQDIDILDVFKEGGAIRNNVYWTQAGGTNVNFMEDCGQYIKVRTFERGVEDETYSCGTGVTACALESYFIKNQQEIVQIKTKGGELSVRFAVKTDDSFTDIWLNGPAEFVFQGEIEV
ncbi:diaminopimelate epimerase [Marinilongibacter aquaticus]|uniref:diaminopimelate epimerase n=1 Tax=Marinilongibacter aquaticus TaxID=2975157 RepID=UPI0021BDAB9A|nr:diaminopimelate epimerase [Marinilongibacter aquaticus]UBM60543.1 diaminopimelate epimerase [Marinilongibacter aquaticus]